MIFSTVGSEYINIFLPGTPNNQFEMIKLMFGETTISYLLILYPPIETAIYKWMAIRSQVYTIYIYKYQRGPKKEEPRRHNVSFSFFFSGSMFISLPIFFSGSTERCESFFRKLLTDR